jgi:hypothetical protein
MRGSFIRRKNILCRGEIPPPKESPRIAAKKNCPRLSSSWIICRNDIEVLFSYGELGKIGSYQEMGREIEGNYSN